MTGERPGLPAGEVARLLHDWPAGEPTWRVRSDELVGLPEGGGVIHRHYRPHRDAEPNSWRSAPGICRTPMGREVLCAGLNRQRERLRAGLDLNGHVHVRAPFGHIGGVVPELLKNEAAAREFAAVDVVALVLADFPTEADRPGAKG
ncbi:hypothetical protein AB0G35_27635 [Streptomyces sp. NPDC021749]|uniref:hypothetical protein n=1 Tax=Streptomyces sp. NPDC021749 TaxID=3154905 RepID=UPI0033E25EDD